MSDKTDYLPTGFPEQDKDLAFTDQIRYNGSMLFKDLSDEDIDNIENLHLDENGYLNPPF